MGITKEQFMHVFPNAKDVDRLLEIMEVMFPRYDITTPERIAAFLAQCGHESGGFRVRTENLNYSAKSLDAVFAKYFVKAGRDAKAYEKQPEKIANIVYASRMGNGDTASGDGWKYRGRGYIQLTGHDNYASFAKDIFFDIDETIAYLDTVDGALESALWYWKKNGLNAYADKGDIVTMTKRINGGTIGLEDRKKHWEELLAVLGGKVSATAAAEPVFTTLKEGSRGDAVKKLQEKLRIQVNGVFGPTTKTAVIAFQKANGLTPDGIVGPKTYAKIVG